MKLYVQTDAKGKVFPGSVVLKLSNRKPGTHYIQIFPYYLQDLPDAVSDNVPTGGGGTYTVTLNYNGKTKAFTISGGSTPAEVVAKAVTEFANLGRSSLHATDYMVFQPKIGMTDVTLVITYA